MKTSIACLVLLVSLGSVSAQFFDFLNIFGRPRVPRQFTAFNNQQRQPQNNFRQNNNFQQPQNNNFQQPQNNFRQAQNTNFRQPQNTNFRQPQNNNFRQPQNNNNFRPNNNNFNQPQNNNFRPNNVRAINNNNQAFRTNPAPAFQQPFIASPANSRDALGNEVYPGCNGTVCLPEADLCSTRQNKAGHFFFGGKSYWRSWDSDEKVIQNARWNWFTGRNYCRKMCMDMVSFETEAEQNFVADLMRSSSIKDLHTSGRLCDAEVEGCDKQDRFKPLNINGWFWASTLQMMPPTNAASSPNRLNNWSSTGPKGAKQPDGNIKDDGFGVEACMALLDNKFGDGLKWHDEPCNTRRVLVCEDLPQANINFVRNQNPGVVIP